jgi:hypothetical protein
MSTGTSSPYQAKSSDPHDANGAAGSPPSRRSQCRAPAASPGSLTSAGSPFSVRICPVQPWDAAIPATVSAIVCWSRSASARCMVRSVPVAVARSGITFGASAAASFETVSTAGCIGFTLRRTVSCSASTARHSAGTGSTARCGYAPWPP